MSGEWDEERHPRNERGQFGGGLSAWVDKKVPRTLAEKMGVREATPKEFHEAFAKAFEGSEFTNHVTHYTPEQLKGMKLFMSADGKAGIAVHDHGDGRIEGTALFNTGGTKGGGLAMLDHAINHGGVNYVECFGPVLNKLYESLGFKVRDKFPFDPTQAAPDWNATKFDSPDYHTMFLERPKKSA